MPKKTPDIIHDEFVDHEKHGTCKLPWVGASTPIKVKVTGLVNPMEGEVRCNTLGMVAEKLGMKIGDRLWAYSQVHEDWFYGEIVGANEVAIHIYSSTYKDAQTKEHLIPANGLFFSSRLSKKFRRTYE